MTGEDKYTQDRRARLEELENDPRAQTIHVSPTQAAAAAQKASFSTIPLEKVDEYRKFEEDWKKRKDDMIQSRERMSTLYQNRERLCVLFVHYM